MRSFQSLAIKSVFAFGLALLLLPSVTIAQQPAASRKKVPRLTTDDVIKAKTDQATVEQLTEAAPAKEAASSKPGEAAKPGDG